MKVLFFSLSPPSLPFRLLEVKILTCLLPCCCVKQASARSFDGDLVRMIGQKISLRSRTAHS